MPRMVGRRKMHSHAYPGWIKIMLIVTLIPLLLLSQAYVALGASDKIALSADRLVYSIGMKMTVAGQVIGSFDPSSPAGITVTAPSGTSYHSAVVSVDESGGFVHEFVIEGGESLVGKNTVEVTHQTPSGEMSGMLSFEVRERASITMTTDKSSYRLGDDVTLQGRVSPVLPDLELLVQVFNPQSVAWSFKSVPAGMISSDGQFTVLLGNLAGDRSVTGTYIVKAFYAASTASAEIRFEAVEQGSQTEQSGEEEQAQAPAVESEETQKLEVVEKEGTSVTAAEIAEETVVESEIKNMYEESQEFTYIVLIKDSDGLTVSLSWAKGTIAPNESLTMGQSWIPEVAGEYTVEIFVWESFLNPVPLSDKTVKTILVE